MSPERLKRKAKRRAAGGSFICPLCGKGFTRRSTVKDPHFPACVTRHGNPNNIQWDADKSCRARRVGRKNRGSSSATCAPEFQQSEREDDEADNRGNEEVIIDDEELQHQHLEPRSKWQDNNDKGSGVEATEVPSMTSGRWNPAVNRPRTPGFAITEDEDEDESTEDLPPETPTGCCNPSNHTFTPETPILPIERRDPLSAMTMNRLFNIPIKSCRIHAGKGDKEARNMWLLWNRMLPQGARTNITSPAPGLDQKSRQQAVVWIAQDVYAALLNRVRGLRDQLQMAVVWRDIAQGMGDGDGVAKIHDLLIVELGEEGPMLLGEFGGVDLGVL